MEGFESFDDLWHLNRIYWWQISAYICRVANMNLKEWNRHYETTDKNGKRKRLQLKNISLVGFVGLDQCGARGDYASCLCAFSPGLCKSYLRGNQRKSKLKRQWCRERILRDFRPFSARSSRFRLDRWSYCTLHRSSLFPIVGGRNQSNVNKIYIR